MKNEPDAFSGPSKPPTKPPKVMQEHRHCPACGVQWSTKLMSPEDWRCFICGEVGFPGKQPRSTT